MQQYDYSNMYNYFDYVTKPTSTSPTLTNLHPARYSLTMLCYGGSNSLIRNPIEAHEYLLESLIQDLSNNSGPTSIALQEGIQIITTSCYYFWQVLCHLLSGLGPCNFAKGPSPGCCAPPAEGEPPRGALGRPSPWPPPPWLPLY